jgi:hypothetical protein
VRRIAFAVAFILAVLTASAQTSNSPGLPSYAGRWQASFQGKPFFTVILTQSGKGLTGTINHTRDIHVNNKGVVDKVASDMAQEQVVDTKLVGNHLRIVGKDDETQEENVYDLQLVPTVIPNSDKTEFKNGLLRMVRTDMPSDIPTIQPWKVTWVSAK